MSIGKRGLLVVGAVVAAGVVAAVAFGQEVIPTRITAVVKVTPDKAGTPDRPRGIGIVARGTIDAPGETGAPMPRSVDLWLPKGWIYNGDKHPACALATLSHRGPAGCPRQSFMGRVDLGHVEDRPSSTPSQAMVFNGGRTKMYFWVVLRDPARVQVAVAATIAKLRSPRWSSRVHADIPSSLRVVSGVPTALKSFDARIGRDDWLATTSCPRDHRWRYHLRLTYPSGQRVDTGGGLTCRS